MMIGKRHFSKKVEASSELHLHCDGSCIGNGQENAECGIGVYIRGHEEYNLSLKLKENEIGESRMTSASAEILAATYALQQALAIINDKKIQIEKVIVKTDSQYIVNAMNDWIYNWIKNGWLTAHKKEVTHKQLFLKLLMLKREFPLETKILWQHVKGHSKSKGNNSAHELANSSVRAKKY